MKNQLFILPNNPGDVLMALEVIAQYKSQNPTHILYFAVDSESFELVRQFPQVDYVIELPRKRIKNLPLHEAQSEINSFIESIQKINWDQVFNLFQHHSGALISSLIKSQKTWGPTWHDGQIRIKDFWTSYLWSIPAHRQENQHHVIDIYKKICKIKPHFPILAHPKTLPIPFALPSAFWAIQLGSAWIGKMWPLKEFKKLIEMILKNHKHLSIVLIGSPEEKTMAEECIQGFDLNRVINLVGQTSLSQTPSILSKAQKLITGDTFAMHLGALFCPVIALFGASSPVETGPYGPGHWVLRAQVEPQSTSQSQAEDFEFSQSNLALTQLKAEYVFEFIHKGIIHHRLEVLQTQWNPQFHFQYLKCHSLSHPPQRQIQPFITFFQVKMLQEELEICQELLQKTQLKPSFDWAELKVFQSYFNQWQSSAQQQFAAEQYCLLMNGLDFQNIKEHLQQRQELLEKFISLPYERVEYISESPF